MFIGQSSLGGRTSGDGLNPELVEHESSMGGALTVNGRDIDPHWVGHKLPTCRTF